MRSALLPEVVRILAATRELADLGLFAAESARELTDDSVDTRRFLVEDTELLDDVDTMSGFVVGRFSLAEVLCSIDEALEDAVC